MRVVSTDEPEPPPMAAIATDSACDCSSDAEPEPAIPFMAQPDWTVIQPDADEMAEADLISSFYAGKPYERGRQMHEEFLQKKAETVSISLATSQAQRKGKRHAW